MSKIYNIMKVGAVAIVITVFTFLWKIGIFLLAFSLIFIFAARKYRKHQENKTDKWGKYSKW